MFPAALVLTALTATAAAKPLTPRQMDFFACTTTCANAQNGVDAAWVIGSQCPAATRDALLTCVNCLKGLPGSEQAMLPATQALYDECVNGAVTTTVSIHPSDLVDEPEPSTSADDNDTVTGPGRTIVAGGVTIAAGPSGGAVNGGGAVVSGGGSAGVVSISGTQISGGAGASATPTGSSHSSATSHPAGASGASGASPSPSASKPSAAAAAAGVSFAAVLLAGAAMFL
ncbi:uncharacterized protein LOC62_02G002651 [Vanrija pseudolonga]|uniref:Extracellular membrane protein CFEM domain-containing protein n=1 Tax=Vanrija pseudolonga TaxID=143232 RepID=A0AAF0Y2P7_9TREE|nr:hypothetical protein LOC62_02G002651 [Vanrija pseudolonga]